MEVLQKVSKEQLLDYQRRRPNLSDLELICLSLTAEFMGIDSENDLFRKLSVIIASKIDSSVYNRRRRKLVGYMADIRLRIASHFNEFKDYFIVDSMLWRSVNFREVPVRGSVKRMPVLFRTKAIASPRVPIIMGINCTQCVPKGTFQSVDLSPASVHDVNCLKDIRAQMSDCTLIGDRGYLSVEIQLNLFETCNIKLNTPMRSNQKGYKEQPYIFRKKRKRIETLFSQLCDQFMTRRNYAKSFRGFKTRILSKIAALTTIQYINKFIFDRNINSIKISII